MFMCKECHKDDEERGVCSPSHFESPFALSHGKCEICGKVADCVDCKAYKYIKEDDK
jgi:hypothetical protein